MNKDGVVSIGIEYKKEFNQMISDYESALSEMASNKTLSKGMKVQFENVIAELRSFKAEMDKQLSGLSVGKVDIAKFESFKKSVSKKFDSINGDISTLNTAVSLLNEKMDMVGNGIDLSKIQNDFKGLKDYINRTNDAVDEFVKRMDGQGIHLFSYDKTNQKEIQTAIKMIDSELKNLDKDYGAKFELFNEKEAQNELDKLATELRSTIELLDSAKSTLSNMDSSSDIFKKTIGEITALELKAARLSDTMEILYDTASEKELSIGITDDKNLASYDKYIDELSVGLDAVSKSAERAKKELSSLLGGIKNTSSVQFSDKLNPNSAQLTAGVTIEADSNELWKKISPVLTDLQNKLNSNPVIAPVKLVVAPTAVSQNDNPDQSISTAYSQKYAKKLAQTGEDAIIDMEGVYKKTYTSIMDEAVKCAEESIIKIQDIFEKTPINIKLQLSQEQLDQINNFVLSNQDEKKIDISGQVDKVKTDVSELNNKLKETTELVQKATQNGSIKFDGIEDFTKHITNSLLSLEKLQDILKTLQNVEITLSNVSGVNSITEIDNQWEALIKRINNAIKVDGTFRKNVNVGKLASEYQKYLDMGGKNELSSISKLKDNETVINAIISKMKELSSQKVDTSSVNKTVDSFDKFKSSLDDIILRLDHLLNLTRDIGNTFLKMLQDTSISNVDKQWSSIESKFRSIADESGKINLSKQKKDIRELVEMYQKYVNAGGMNTPVDLTDNTETIKKMNKVYEQMNSKKDGTSVTNETKNFTKIEDSVNSLTSAINTKTEAITTEANTMELAARAEVKSIQKIIDALNPLIEKIKNIPELKILREDTTLPSQETNISLDDSSATSVIDKQLSSTKKLIGEEEKLSNIQNKIISFKPKNKDTVINEKTEETLQKSSEYASKLLETAQQIVRLANNNVGFISAEDLAEIEKLYQLFPELRDFRYNDMSLDFMSKSDLDDGWMDAFMDFSATLPKAAEYFEMIDEFSSHLSDDGRFWGNEQDFAKDFLHVDPDVLDRIAEVNNVLNEALGTEENYTSKYKEVGQQLKDGSIDIQDAIRDILQLEFPNNKIMEIPDGFWVAPEKLNKTTKSIEDVSSAISDVSNKVLQFPDKNIVLEQDKIQDELQQTQNEIDSTQSKYQSLLDVAKKQLDDDSKRTNYYSGRTTETQAFANFKFSEQAKRSNYFDVLSKDYDELCDLIDKTEEELKSGSIGFDDAIDRMVAAYQKYDATTKIDVGGFDFLNKMEIAPSVLSDAEKAILSENEAIKESEYTLQDYINAYIELKKVKESSLSVDPKIKGVTPNGRPIIAEGSDESFKAELMMKDMESEVLQIYGKDLSVLANEHIKASASAKEHAKAENQVTQAIKDASSTSSQHQTKDAFQVDNSSVTNASTSAIKEENNALEQLTESTNQLNVIQAKSDSTYWQNRFKESVKDMTSTNDELVKMKKYYQDMSREAEKAYNAFEKQKTSYVNKLTGYTDTTKYTSDFINRASTLQKEVTHLDLTNPQDVTRLQEIDAEVIKIINDSKLLENKLVKQRSKLSEIVSQMKIFKSQNTRMSGSQKSELDRIIKYAETMQQSGKEVSSEVENIKVRFAGLKAVVNETGQAGKNFLDTIKDKAWYSWATQFASMFSLYDVINGIRRMSDAVIELNTNITELAKVSDVSVSSVYQDFQSYADISKEIGGTISDTISATTDWSRNGYSLPDSKQLAEVAQLYKNVGDGIDIDEANASLISTLRGFQLEADQAEHIIDVFNEVSNNEPIDSGGIGDALQRSAASFNAANTSLEKSVSLITGTNSVLQDPEKVGNMWKTVSARLRGANAELKEMGEDTDGMVTSTSKLRDLIKGMTGFDIMKDDNTFKDVYDIVVGIGEKWDSLSDVNQASLLEKLAGKNQSNALAAALANVDTIKKAYGEATNAEGSARKEQERVTQSIQYSINQAKASLEELSNDVLNSNFLKGAIDNVGKFVDLLDHLVDSAGVVPTLLTGIAGFASIKDNFGKLFCF